MRNIGSFLKRLWAITKSYWSSEEKWYARILLAIIIGLNLGHVYVLVLLNQWNNTFYNTLQNHDKEGFFSSLGDFTILAVINIVVAVYALYLQQLLEIRWRRWLTEHYLQKWLQNRVYYLMQLTNKGTDNPDQRISEDLRMFVSLTLSLSLGLLKATVTLVSFVAILWGLSGTLEIPFGQGQVTIQGYMVWVALVYAMAGTWLTSKIGWPLVGLNYNQQRYEADFRFSLVRLRENSESIAFYGGERREQENFSDRFKFLFKNFRELMRRQKKLTWFTSGYGQVAIIFPFLVAAPRYFSNQLQLGGLIQTASAFGRVQDALSFFVDSYTSLAEWQAVVKRLTGFIDHMEEVRQIPEMVQVYDGPNGSLQASDLMVGLPAGQQLFDDFSLQMSLGDTLLVAGPSGCGKSTLLRTLAGIWPFGKGAIAIPHGEKILFIPQKPYLPLGTLRDVLLYPDSSGITDQDIQEVLVLCRLDKLADQLARVEAWSHILSLGEQQRIAFARAILQRPQWLFMDEATSGLDEPSEQELYQVLLERLKGSAIISVGHRSTLNAYHKQKLQFGIDGKWSLVHDEIENKIYQV